LPQRPNRNLSEYLPPGGLLPKITTLARNRDDDGISFDCAGRFAVSWSQAGHSRTIAMIETVTALCGALSAGIFLAHALDSFWSRPQPALSRRSGDFSGRRAD
jgi:hypothetical protein